MRRSPRSPLLSLLLLTLAPSAHAQAPRSPPVPAVPDADKDAARNLFKEGYELQAAGRYAEALERFKRSEQVYPAPTALLHIAECEAQLQRLVEAAETYRELTRQQLPAGSPPPFVAAQAQGAAELQQIEPRIPHVRITVAPENVPGVSVSVDGQPMNVALLGVDRAIDPGEHKVGATAPGYERTEVSIRVEERTPTQAVALTLQPLTPLLVAPAPLPAAPPSSPAPQPQIIYLTPQAPQPAPAQRFYVPIPDQTPAVPAGPVPSRKGLFMGPRLGVVVPDGSTGLSDTVKSGFSIGAELDFRFSRRFFIGAVIDHGFLGAAGKATSDAVAAGLGSASFSTTNVDAVIGVITSPDHVAALFETGVGYRTVSGTEFSSPVSSPELVLGAGVWIPAGNHFRIVPRLDATFGSLQGTDAIGGNVSYGYAMLTFVVGGYYNLDFH